MCILHPRFEGLEPAKLGKNGLISGVKHTYLPFYTNLVDLRKIGDNNDNIFTPLNLFFI